MKNPWIELEDCLEEFYEDTAHDLLQYEDVVERRFQNASTKGEGRSTAELVKRRDDLREVQEYVGNLLTSLPKNKI